MINRNARPVTVLALIHVFLIVAVFLLVGFFMKLQGYPDGRPWPFLPLFIREHVFYLLAASVAWAGLTVYAATKPTYFYRIMLIAGVVLAAVAAFLGVAAVGIAMVGPKQPLMMSIE